MPDVLDLRLSYAARYDCAEVLRELKDAYDRIADRERQKSTVGQELSSTKKVMDDMQLTASLNVEGRNADERKARLVEYLQRDADYQAICKHHDALQDQSNSLSIDISAAGRQVRYLEYRIDYNMAMLRVIGG